ASCPRACSRAALHRDRNGRMQGAPRRAFLLVLLAALSGPAAHAAVVAEPAFVRARPQVAQRLETLLAAQQSAGISPAARPPTPANCSATDSGDVIRFSWDSVAEATGYYVFVDGAIGTKLGEGTTHLDFVSSPGTHSFCVVSVNADGVSDPC